MKQNSFLNLSRKVISFFTLSDVVLTLIIIIIAGMLFISNLHTNNQIVKINYQNKLFGEYELDKPRIIKITQDIEVEISDFKVRMLKNNCPNQLCVEQGWTSNFPIICVPNQVEIIIIDNDKKNEIRQILK